MQLTAAVSPCPNDTFIVHGLVSGAVSVPGVAFDWSFEDVETLNRAAIGQRSDLTKLSFHAYLLVKDTYRLLRAGAALGFGCGPIAVSKTPIHRAELSTLRIAIPGELTTAHLLFRLFCPEAENKVFVRYDDIVPAVKRGDAEVGVIIHEDRFTYQAEDLVKMIDLGDWWEKETGAPIPLGCLALRRSLADELAEPLEAQIRNSITAARDNFKRALPFIRSHARQMDESVLTRHIDTFVNDYSLDLGTDGDRAVDALERMARRAQVIP